jgi:flagellin-like protein
MSNRHLIGNRKRKGISPVIATVMLVAVAVVIAAALAGFSGSLFGSYSSGPQVKIQSMEVNTAGVGTIVMSNNGNSDDAVVKVDVKNVGLAIANVANDQIYVGTPGTEGVVAANSFQQTVDFALDTTGFNPPSSGQVVTATITMASGATITFTIPVVS